MHGPAEELFLWNYVLDSTKDSNFPRCFVLEEEKESLPDTKYGEVRFL